MESIINECIRVVFYLYFVKSSVVYYVLIVIMLLHISKMIVLYPLPLLCDIDDEIIMYKVGLQISKFVIRRVNCIKITTLHQIAYVT